MPTSPNNLLALDIGTVRVGVAIASLASRLPRPLTTLANDDTLLENLQAIVAVEAVDTIVLGLPRGLDGQETSQTHYVREFAAKLQSAIGLPMPFQDEALSSTRAKTELESRGKLYQKGDVDALAATFILEDYLQNDGE